MRFGSKFIHSILEVSHVEFQTYDLCAQKVLFSSGIASKLLGYSDKEYAAISSDFYKSIVHPDDIATVEKAINEIINSTKGKVIEMTLRGRKSDGDYIWLYSRQMIYERNPRRKVLTMIREVEDVTTLIELKTELEEKVERLKAVSFKNSHFLRAPVATIIGLVNLIEEQGVSGAHTQQIIAYLKETIIKLDEVVHQINEDAGIK